eukprot:1591155-Pyramimonas_sp.AAC.1
MWLANPSPTSADLMGVALLHSGAGFAVGAEDTVLVSRNFGASWTVRRTGLQVLPLLQLVPAPGISSCPSSD